MDEEDDWGDNAAGDDAGWGDDDGGEWGNDEGGEEGGKQQELTTEVKIANLFYEGEGERGVVCFVFYAPTTISLSASLYFASPNP